LKEKYDCFFFSRRAFKRSITDRVAFLSSGNHHQAQDENENAWLANETRPE
jgi:hypothetical protein